MSISIVDYINALKRIQYLTKRNKQVILSLLEMFQLLGCDIKEIVRADVQGGPAYEISKQFHPRHPEYDRNGWYAYEVCIHIWHDRMIVFRKQSKEFAEPDTAAWRKTETILFEDIALNLYKEEEE